MNFIKKEAYNYILGKSIPPYSFSFLIIGSKNYIFYCQTVKPWYVAGKCPRVLVLKNSSIQFSI